MLTNVINNMAFRWYDGVLAPIVFPEDLLATKLLGVDKQNELLRKNIKYFLQGKEALNVLLWGEKGMGKSTMVKLLLRDYFKQGLRILEFSGNDYFKIYELYDYITHNKNYFFIFYFDDLSFSKDDLKFNNFKTVIEGGLEERPSNTIFIATSNRKHLVVDSRGSGAESIEGENSSFSSSFGLNLSFPPVPEDLFLQMVSSYMKIAGLDIPEWESKALNYASERGGKSGRLAQQFVTYSEILSINL